MIKVSIGESKKEITFVYFVVEIDELCHIIYCWCILHDPSTCRETGLTRGNTQK